MRSTAKILLSSPPFSSPLDFLAISVRSISIQQLCRRSEIHARLSLVALTEEQRGGGGNRAPSYRNRLRPFTIHDRYRTVAYQLRYLNLKNPLAAYPLVLNELRSRQSRRVDSANSQLNRIIRNQIRGVCGGRGGLAAVVLVFDPVGHARPSLRDERGKAQPRCSPSP